MNGGHYAPLGWGDIVSWIEGAGMQIVEPQWRREVISLSGHYAAMANAAREMECPAPYEPEAV